MLKFLLIPLVLIAAGLAAMSVQIAGSIFYHRLAWNATQATVTRAERACAVTYQPADAMLRQTAEIGPCDKVGKKPLPAGGNAPRILADLYGRLVYSAAGSEYDFEGKLSDVGVYNITAGMTVPLLYDPSNPSQLASGEMQGWKGGLLILLSCLGFIAFYTWFFWLRRR